MIVVDPVLPIVDCYYWWYIVIDCYDLLTGDCYCWLLILLQLLFVIVIVCCWLVLLIVIVIASIDWLLIHCCYLHYRNWPDCPIVYWWLLLWPNCVTGWYWPVLLETIDVPGHCYGGIIHLVFDVIIVIDVLMVLLLLLPLIRWLDNMVVFNCWLVLLLLVKTKKMTGIVIGCYWPNSCYHDFVAFDGCCWWPWW